MTIQLIIFAFCVVFDAWYFATVLYFNHCYKTAVGAHQKLHLLVEEQTDAINKMADMAGGLDGFEVPADKQPDETTLLSEQILHNESNKKILDVFVEFHPNLKKDSKYMQFEKEYTDASERLAHGLAELSKSIEKYDTVIHNPAMQVVADSLHLHSIVIPDKLF